jgi:hypothetical protein
VDSIPLQTILLHHLYTQTSIARLRWHVHVCMYTYKHGISTRHTLVCTERYNCSDLWVARPTTCTPFLQQMCTSATPVHSEVYHTLYTHSCVHTTVKLLYRTWQHTLRKTQLQQSMWTTMNFRNLSHWHPWRSQYYGRTKSSSSHLRISKTLAFYPPIVTSTLE